MDAERDLALNAQAAEANTQLQNLQAQHAEGLKVLSESLFLEHSQEAVISSKHQEDLTQQRIVELREAWEIETTQQLLERGVLAEKVLTEHLHEQAVAMEAERSRGLKLEASKWKQALKEAEKRLALEVNHARMDAREEREREVQIEMLEWEKKVTSDVNVVNERHREVFEEVRDLTLT
jgi:hypothetical protein